VEVQILNGWNRRDAEQLAAAALRWEGYQVVGTGLADSQDYARTKVVVFRGDPAAGERIADQLGVPLTSVVDLTDVQEQIEPETTAEIQIILGKNYNPCQQ
jgi:hypothetical protein